MKLDTESILVHSNLSEDGDYQIFKYKNILDTGQMKINNAIMGEDKKGIVSDQKIKKYDMDTDIVLAAEVVQVSGADESAVKGDLVNSVHKETEDSVNPFTDSVAKEKFYEKERDFYTDKTVIDCELPELMVCFKEGTCHVVKDICIDDGLPSLDKVFIESSEIQNKEDANLQHSIENSDFIKEKGDTAASISNWRNPFLEYDYETDGAKRCGSGRLIQNGTGDFHDIVDDVSNEKSMPTNLDWTKELDVANSLDDVSDEKTMPLEVAKPSDDVPDENVMPEALCFPQELDVGNSLEDVSDKKAMPETLHLVEELDVGCSHDDISDEKPVPDNIHVSEELDVVSSPDSSHLDENKDLQHCDQDASKETNSTSNETSSTNCVILSAVEELNNDNKVTENPLSSKLESGSITFDFDSSLAATSGREEDSKETDSQEPVHPLNTQGTEEGTVDSRTTSSRSFFIQHGHGESSFSAAGPLSGPISYSGPIPYSGSISHRSDSSTTSTRSFAFPILNSEWNSSPVKMAKAERRKHRGWRVSHLCCRF